MVPIVTGILTGASCLAVKEDVIGELCHRVSPGIAIRVIAYITETFMPSDPCVVC